MRERGDQQQDERERTRLAKHPNIICARRLRDSGSF
jgi:hypothetical protein